MSVFDWCATANQHDECRVRYKKFWFEKRKRKEVLVFADEDTVCECTCHNPDAKTTKPKTRRRKK